MIRYLNLPAVPQSIIDNFNYNFDEYNRRDVPHDINDKDANSKRVATLWTESFNEEINKWCQDNICDSMYWAFLLTDGELAIHKEEASLGLAATKLNYVIRPGGADVVTEFWEDDKKTLKHSFCIEPFRWHLIKADTYHSVRNIEPGQHRFLISGKVFP